MGCLIQNFLVNRGLVRTFVGSCGSVRYCPLLSRDFVHLTSCCFMMKLVFTYFLLQVYRSLLVSFVPIVLFTVKLRYASLTHISPISSSYRDVPFFPPLHSFYDEFLCLLYRPLMIRPNPTNGLCST